MTPTATQGDNTNSIDRDKWRGVSVVGSLGPVFWTYFIILLSVFSIWLVGHWPGLFIWDTFVNLDDARAGVLNRWVSYSYSYYLIALTRVYNAPQFIGFVQITLAATVAAGFFAWAYARSGRSPIIHWLFALFLIMPMNSIMNIYYTRDWLFSWIAVSVAMLFSIFALRWRAEGISPTPLQWALLALLTTIVGDLRQDNLFILALLPALVFIVFWRGKRVLMNFSVWYISFLLLSASIGLYHPSPNWLYRLTGIINPMSYMLHHGYQSENSEEDHMVLDQVVDYDAFMKMEDDYEIPGSLDKYRRAAVSPEDFDAFQRLYLKMVVRAPHLFLENRAKMTLAAMGVGGHTHYFTDDLTSGNAQIVSMAQNLQIQKNPPSKLLNTGLNRLSAIFFKSCLKVIFGNTFPAVILCLLALVMARAMPVSAAASALILLRVPGVVLLAPAPQFKYLYSVYLFGFFLPALMLIEWRSRSSARMRLSHS